MPGREDRGYREFIDRQPLQAANGEHIGQREPGEHRGRDTSTPVEVGWQRAVKFDHEFIGRKALEEEVEDIHGARS